MDILGGSSPEPDGWLDCGEVEGELGGEVDAGVVLGAASGGADFFAGSRVSRGAPSPVSMPTGTVSALIPVAADSVPAGTHLPVPIQGVATLAAVLCSALLTVNKPAELPERSASYTVPDSNAMGMGSALYALASQNLPPVRIATGIRVDLPFAEIWSTPMPRGPASFFRGAFRSPGVICGRSSSCCADISTGQDALHASSASRNQPRHERREIRKCKICENVGWPGGTWAACLGLECGFLGEIAMNINDKAPDFTLPDENGKDLALKDLRGKVVVLFFYPRADTPG